MLALPVGRVLGLGVVLVLTIRTTPDAFLLLQTIFGGVETTPNTVRV